MNPYAQIGRIYVFKEQPPPKQQPLQHHPKDHQPWKKTSNGNNNDHQNDTFRLL